MTVAPLPLSVLDLAMVSEGSTSAQALADTTEVARSAEALGYTRIWVAEHHNMATVASTVPSVLMAHLAANTSTIKVGSGGVMLPNHAPLSVAEQFALLEALHPGRIDLGIGRAPGSDRATAAALRRTDENRDDEDFPRNLLDLMGLLGDPRSERGLWQHFRATPVATSHPSVILLGSSGFSAQLAGILGLPFGFAHHFDMGGTVEAVGIYRHHFQPSDILDEPYTLVTASAIAADTTEEARWLAGPSQLRRYGMRTGRFLPLLPPDEAAAHPHFAAAQTMPTASIVGTADEVTAGLHELAERTQASELMLYTATYGLPERLNSLELIAHAWPTRPTADADGEDATADHGHAMMPGAVAGGGGRG
ncbi:MAG: LLM class flavin-dependent oxidoreductase [Acidimicrobiia bacterium]|nr:LLM class flavin-dependent oxidoreductase [Acidimicrobiia bacterium]